MSHGLITDARLTRGLLLEQRTRPVHIIGAASAEGVAVLRLLLNLGFEDIIIHDVRERAELRKAFRTTHGAWSRIEQDELWERLAPIYDRGRFGADDYLSGMDDAALVVLGQGWYLEADNRARVADAIPTTALITSMTELYFALHRGPIASITGTNGKSTTIALAEHLLRTADLPFRTAGNERSNRQFLPEIDSVPAGTWALLEVSNRQLLQLSRGAQVAAITSLTPDHLEEHDGFAGYRDTKAKLFEHQNSHDVAIVNADDPSAVEVARRSPAARANRLVLCGVGSYGGPSVSWRDGVLVAEDVPMMSGDGRRDGQTVIATRGDLRLLGDHNLRNAAVAVALAIACGADPSALAQGLRTFEGKALRLQRIEDVDGVEVWSDLKATTPEATMVALEALAPAKGPARRVLLIAGGDDKGLDYTPLARSIAARGVRVLAVPGSATDALERACAAAAVDAVEGMAFERVAGLGEALDRAFELAASGDVVIVSPAAAGFWTRELRGGTSLRRLIRQRARVPQEVPER